MLYQFPIIWYSKFSVILVVLLWKSFLAECVHIHFLGSFIIVKSLFQEESLHNCLVERF